MQLVKSLSSIFWLDGGQYLKNNTDFSQTISKKANISILNGIAKDNVRLHYSAKLDVIIPKIVLTPLSSVALNF